MEVALPDNRRAAGDKERRITLASSFSSEATNEIRRCPNDDSFEDSLGSIGKTVPLRIQMGNFSISYTVRFPGPENPSSVM